jgi:kojibiose phosphorylase
LSACAYAMVAADIGKLDWAYKYFIQTAKIDLEVKYKVYVGTIFMGGSHPAANGGAWMTAVFGFGGVKASENQIAIHPRLCQKWRKLEFNLVHCGDQFEIKISKNGVTIIAGASNRTKHKFVIAGKTQFISPDDSLTLKY